MILHLVKLGSAGRRGNPCGISSSSAALSGSDPCGGGANVQMVPPLGNVMLDIYAAGISLFKALIQTRTKTIWFANAKFEPRFGAKGFPRPRNEPVRSRVRINT